MRWTMPILAYYLLEAGTPLDDAAIPLLGAWQITGGDDQYIGPDATDGTTIRVGAFAIPLEWRSGNWPNGKSKVAADAAIVAETLRDNPGELNYMLIALRGEHRVLLSYAYEALRNPVAGYADPADALQALIPPPITSPRPGR